MSENGSKKVENVEIFSNGDLTLKDGKVEPLVVPRNDIGMVIRTVLKVLKHIDYD